MSDYYTNFSCTLDVGSAENVAKALELYRDYATELERDETMDIGFAAQVHSQANTDTAGTAIWIHDDGVGDVEHVIVFARRCGQALGLSGRWGFQYANTCSRPRLDGFVGGGHVLDLATGETIGWTDTNGWLATILSDDADGRRID